MEPNVCGLGKAWLHPSSGGFGFLSKWPGWTEKMNSQMAVSVMSPLFANIVAAKFPVMQRYLE